MPCNFSSGPLAWVAEDLLTFEGLRMALEGFCSAVMFAKDNTKHIKLPVLYASLLRKSNCTAGHSLDSNKARH